MWTGAKAVELGLADKNGTLPDALALARELSKSPEAKAVLYKRPYGYTGSIYAANNSPQPQVNVVQLQVPGAESLIPAGFYYLWQP